MGCSALLITLLCEPLRKRHLLHNRPVSRRGDLVISFFTFNNVSLNGANELVFQYAGGNPVNNAMVITVVPTVLRKSTPPSTAHRKTVSLRR